MEMRRKLRRHLKSLEARKIERQQTKKASPTPHRRKAPSKRMQDQPLRNDTSSSKAAQRLRPKNQSNSSLRYNTLLNPEKLRTCAFYQRK